MFVSGCSAWIESLTCGISETGDCETGQVPKAHNTLFSEERVSEDEAISMALIPEMKVSRQHVHRTLLVRLVGRGFMSGKCIAIIPVARPLELLF